MTDKFKPRILFLDAYDSFTNNITCLLRQVLDAQITVIRIDDATFINKDDSSFFDYLRHFDGVVAGPGPGNPRNEQDVGLIGRLWRLPSDVRIPVLGVCLGFQSLVLAFGGSVDRLEHPRHGIIRKLEHRNQSLFQGVDKILATQYHSLHCHLGHGADELRTGAAWRPTPEAPELQPLAWDFSDERNGPVLMAVRHTTRPFWGVQYHPESICTNTEGTKVIANWWTEARMASLQQQGQRACKRRRISTGEKGADSGYSSDVAPSPDDETGSDTPDPVPHEVIGESPATRRTVAGEVEAARRVRWRSITLPSDQDHLPDVVEIARRSTGYMPVILESGTKRGKPVRGETGRFSIVGLVESDAERFEYWTGMLRIRRSRGKEAMLERKGTISDVFEELEHRASSSNAAGGNPDSPFWGGLVGYVSYEAGLETISVPSSPTDGSYPDVTFISIERSLIIDHVAGVLYVQSIRDQDEGWIEASVSAVQDTQAIHPLMPEERHWTSRTRTPERNGYCENVLACQSHIRAGSSYELCLTSQTPLSFHPTAGSASNTTDPSDSWDIYLRLRTTNPAPFAAYLSFSDLTIASSSPERFLSWSRDGRCEFRPIKGTVQKGPGMTREKAEEILKGEKEQAENLMIVDLIRHDLNGVLSICGGQAEVPKLMSVEEYESVYQLVSVIQGRLEKALEKTDQHEAGEEHRLHLPTAERPKDPTGFDVLRASLPPGSMTGAPKKRSCELLRELEDNKPRGIYSGVLGYLDVGGGGDFSVVIRSMVKYPEGWRVGAGGAVTALSDPKAEYDEMMGKLAAVQP